MLKNDKINWLTVGSGARATIILWEIITNIKSQQPTARIFLKNLKLIDNNDLIDFEQEAIFIQPEGNFEYGKDFDFIALEMLKTLKIKMVGRNVRKCQKRLIVKDENWVIGSMLSFLEKYTLLSFEIGIRADSDQIKLEIKAKELINRLSLFNEENVRAFTKVEKIDDFYESVEIINESHPKKVWERFVQFGKIFDSKGLSGENPVELAILLLGFSLYFHKENAEKIYWILDRFEKAYYEIYLSSHKNIPNASNYLFLLIGDVKYYLFKFI